MNKLIVFGILSIFLISFASADILLTQNPHTFYNLGDAVPLPVTVKTTTELSGNLQMDLICNGEEVNFYKNGISLSAGEEKKIDASLVLTKEIIGDLEGFCLIKMSLKNDFVLTEEFRISKFISVDLKSVQSEFDPEETIYIDGEAFKETGEDVDGFVEVRVLAENSTLNTTHVGTVKNGFFTVDFAFPKESKAGKYFLKIKVFEKDESGAITNEGFADHSVIIRQIPTSLEIAFENQEVEPGTDMRVKAILHDQTGEKIESTAILTIKDEDDKILEQTEIATDEYLEFSIKYNDPSEEWTVFGVSNQLSSQSLFEIIEKEEAKTEIINKTLTVTNVGNVPYNKTLSIKIGNSTVNMEVFLKIDEVARYLLSAPEGEYEIEIMDGEESSFSEGVFLTGKAISVKEIRKYGFRNYPLAWVFVIAILGIIAFIVFKKGYKKSFFGYITKGKERFGSPIKKDSNLRTKNKAEISLSVKGEKKRSSILCLKIKDLKDIEKENGSIEDTTQKIINLAGENKAAVYENSEYLFFIFTPLLTKTFKNGRTALSVAQKIKEIMSHHNKTHKHKTEFGISLNEGEIVSKSEEGVLKFMSFGDTLSVSKKIATRAHGDILLSETAKGNLHSVKTEKHTKEGMDVYDIKEVRKEANKEEHAKFIGDFLKRLDKNDK